MNPEQMASQPADNFGIQPRSQNWTSLRLINIYRVAVAAIFFAQSFVEDSPLINIQQLTLFAWVSLGYLLLAVMITLSTWIDRRNFQFQVSVQVYIDIIAIILIMHACGGISSGLGMLLIIAITVAGLLGRQSLAVVFASIASVGLLGEFLFSMNYTNYAGTSTQVGILGAALFATALVTQTLTQRIRRHEVVIQQQKIDVANLSALNAEIIQNMQSGVIALDSNDQVRHINDMAKHMLRETETSRHDEFKLPFNIKNKLPDIYQALHDWRDSTILSNRFLTNIKRGSDIQVSFHKLESASHQGTLIFLDDVSKLKQQMQQSKLASLGQLTANIAHEIRNPLGAIVHASQLLAENEELPDTEKRMTEIIQQHSKRINSIIEDIMQISKGRIANKDVISLEDWLGQFIDDYCHGGDNSKDCFELHIADKKLNIIFDSGHLNRIMTNLANNARMHGNEELPVVIKVYRDEEGLICIEVADRGDGIDNKELDKIFEPFYTTNHKGTGLGLYIVSQLCDLNDARIGVQNNEHGGTSFILRTLPN